ncbi:MAG: 30S ribosomal protein S8e [Thaumarchaeota archaeon]|nr:30S ribosomal protein S8e [Nitrososphaerota archaeon]
MGVKPYENLEKRKATGGRRKRSRGRRKYERDGYPLETVLGEPKLVKKRARGGNVKLGLRSVNYANVADGAKVTKVKILKVLENPANRDYERRGVITKGAIIETELGRARVVSRPSQDGVVNAVLLK